MSAVDVLAVTREMRERKVNGHAQSRTLVAWADRVEAAMAEREAAVAELIAAANEVADAMPKVPERLRAALARVGGAP